MKQYNMEAETVTISINDYADLVADQGLLRALQYYGVSNWEGYDEAYHDYATSDRLSFNELNAFALRLMQDEDASDYDLSIAMQWLQHQIAFNNATRIGEWVAISRDLEQQLRAIYRQIHLDSV